MRYFFHVRNGGTVYIDEVGRRFINAGNAKAHAAVIASELAFEGGKYDGFLVCVIDEKGSEIARVPIVGNGK